MRLGPNACPAPESSNHPPSIGGPSEPRCGSRWLAAILGSGIGLGVGGLWALLFGPLTDGPPSLALSFLIYTTGFALTGLAVGAIRRSPPLAGAVVGFVALSTWAAIAGPKDGWLVLWVMVLGGSGLCWGGIIGVVFWAVHKRLAAWEAFARREGSSSPDWSGE